MTNDTKYLCTECTARYRDNDFLVSDRPRGVTTGKCVECKKVKAVGGVLVGERSRR